MLQGYEACHSPAAQPQVPGQHSTSVLKPSCADIMSVPSLLAWKCLAAVCAAFWGQQHCVAITYDSAHAQHARLWFLLQLMMCGQTPEVIAASALTAMNFYVEQQRLSGMYENHQLKQKMEIIQTQCKEKLMQMQHAYQQVTNMTCWSDA